MATCLGSKQDQLALTIFPAVLNALSDETDVAGMHKYLRANFAIRGNCMCSSSTTREVSDHRHSRCQVLLHLIASFLLRTWYI